MQEKGGRRRLHARRADALKGEGGPVGTWRKGGAQLQHTRLEAEA